MRLDVIVPTYNRHDLLPHTLDSLTRATIPEGLEVSITVVDNNSSDDTKRVVEEWKARFPGFIELVFESKQGRSHALNAGIEATHGDLIGTIDDDEEVDQSWFECVYHAFSNWEIDFLGGPYVPQWQSQPPTWLPREYCGVIGDINAGEKIVPYDASYPGILMGGNAVFTRLIINKVGRYLTSVGRKRGRLLAGEDDDMYRRLLDVGARGVYFPSLKIFHHVPDERLTKSYFRRWCFWRGVSCGVLDRKRRQEVAYLCGIPRYLYGDAARGMLRNATGRLSGSTSPSRLFANQLKTFDLIGYFYGKHFYSTEDQS